MLVIGITVPAVAFLSKRYSNRALLIVVFVRNDRR